MAGYYFNLPQITQLTIPQQAALNETKQIALSGGPGTGKSVVSLWRHISNYKQNKKSLLLTYTTSLARYLKTCCVSQSQEAANNVGRSYKDKSRIHNEEWTEIVIDEAQDLSREYYDAIAGIKVSYGADDAQILYPDKSITQTELQELFSDNIDYVLDKNFRSTQRIMQLAQTAFPNAYLPQSTIAGCKEVGEMPVLLISGRNRWIDEERRFEISNNKQDKAILDIIHQLTTETHNIAILVPWKKDAIYFEDTIKGAIPDYSIYYEDEIVFPAGCKEIKNVHITTFKSAKGLEFDTVIVPNFDNIHNKVPIIIRKKEQNEDGEEIEKNKVMCSWNDLYVAVTRARSNLYLITSQDMPRLHTVTDKSII